MSRNWDRTANHIADWLRDYLRDAEKEGYVVGISGGVDSAVAAGLAVMGVGHRRVLGLIIPTKFAQNSINASRVVDWLDIPYLYQPMGTVATAMQDIMQIKLDRVAKGNIEARIRMIVLYAYANAKNYLVLGTTNRSEMEVGYFTKHGDGGVDLEPIADLYKTEVWELAKHLGVPGPVIRQAPTAGLWKGQTDEEELGMTYKELDGYLQSPSNFSSDLAQRVEELRRAAKHKLSMPPCCIPELLYELEDPVVERLRLDRDNPADFTIEYKARVIKEE